MNRDQASTHSDGEPVTPEPSTLGSGITTSSEPGEEEPWRPHRVPSVRILKPTESPKASEPAQADVESVADAAVADGAQGVAARGATRILGINLVGSIAYLALLEPPALPLLDQAELLIPESQLDPVARLAEYSSRFAQLLADLAVGVVVVARPLRYTNWRYNDAAERIALETCFALEAHRRGARYESVGQHHAANVVGLPLERCTELLQGKLGIERTSRWADRVPALLVAMAAVVER